MTYLLFFTAAIFISVLFIQRYQKLSAAQTELIHSGTVISPYGEADVNFTKLLLFVAAGVLPFLIAGFRAETVGADTADIYYRYYYQPYCLEGKPYTGTEYGTYLIFRLGYLLFHSFTGVLILYSAITVYFAVAGILYFRKFSNPAVLLFLYLTFIFFDSLNIMRQLSAVSVLIFSLNFLDRKKYSAFFLCVGGAALIHNSALVALILPFAKLFENRERWMCAYLVFICFLLVLLPVIVEIMGLFPIFGKYYNLYKLNFNFSLSNLSLFIYNLPAYAVILYFRKRLLADSRNMLYFVMSLLSLETALFKLYMVWISRLMLYFSIGNYVLLAQCGGLCKDGAKGRALNVFLLIYGLTYFIFYYYVKGNGGIFPYSFA